MSSIGPEGRSFEPINAIDLERLRDIAESCRSDFFKRRPDWAEFYADRFLCSALCQGAALHYVDGKRGINDFDVYNFFEAHPGKKWYAKAKSIRPFGDNKFGRSVDRPDLVGRRVDILSRTLVVRPGEESESALRRYLVDGRTTTAKFLAAKAVVGLEPISIFQKVLWKPV